MNIGNAVELLKTGVKVTRSEGWHGKHFLLLVTTTDDAILVDDTGSLFEKTDGEDYEQQPVRGLNPFVGIVPANDPNAVTPWPCSQADLLADDWETYSPGKKIPRKE